MISLAGILVVFGAIIGGYLMEKGNLMVLLQPAELVIIGGAALGTLLIANPLPLVIRIFKSIGGTISGSRFTKACYLDSLRMLFDIFQLARKSGMAKLEEEVENPKKSALFSKYPKLTKDHHVVHFICDTLRTAAAGVVSPHDLDQMLENDIEVHHQEIAAPVKSLMTIAEALPGLGIVAAVLGVILTMSALGGPPEEIGHKVAAALVGTFLGILMCYGVIAPIAANLEKLTECETQYYQVLRAGIMAFAKGLAPMIATEFARRSIPASERPLFTEMEKACKNAPPAAGAPAGAPAGKTAAAA
jgi:chemotaxis protein MotA